MYAIYLFISPQQEQCTNVHRRQVAFLYIDILCLFCYFNIHFSFIWNVKMKNLKFNFRVLKKNSLCGCGTKVEKEPSGRMGMGTVELTGKSSKWENAKKSVVIELKIFIKNAIFHSKYWMNEGVLVLMYLYTVYI